MYSALSKCQFAIVLALAIGTSAQASAIETSTKLDDIDVEANSTEIEVDLRLVEKNDTLEQQLQLKGERALNDRWAIGGELELEREAGEAITADSVLARVKWRAPKSKSGISVALQTGLGYSFSNDAALSKTEVYLGWKCKGWSVVGRFDLEQVLQGGAEPEVGYRLRVARDVGSDIKFGMEAAGDIWTGKPTKHRLGPYLLLPLGDDDAPTVEVGVFKGLNSISPNMIYRFEVEFEF